MTTANMSQTIPFNIYDVKGKQMDRVFFFFFNPKNEGNSTQEANWKITVEPEKTHDAGLS